MIRRELDKIAQEVNSQPDDPHPQTDDPADFEDENPPDLDIDEVHIPDNDEATPEVPAGPDEDNPDPFEPAPDLFRQPECLPANQPPHLVVIYALASWLHLQFHLPCIACQAFLAIMACLFGFLRPDLTPPFIMMQSATHVLRLGSALVVLPVCPVYREVYPAAGSLHTQDTCIPCSVELFLPDKTHRGNDCAKKIPYIKYPYLPLSMQIHSLLAIPGLEETLDLW